MGRRGYINVGMYLRAGWPDFEIGRPGGRVKTIYLLFFHYYNIRAIGLGTVQCATIYPSTVVVDRNSVIDRVDLRFRSIRAVAE